MSNTSTAEPGILEPKRDMVKKKRKNLILKATDKGVIMVRDNGIQALHTHTCALLSIAEMWGDGDGALLSDTDSNQTLVHAGNHVASTHIGVISTITRVAVEQKI